MDCQLANCAGHSPEQFPEQAERTRPAERTAIAPKPVAGAAFPAAAFDERRQRFVHGRVQGRRSKDARVSAPARVRALGLAVFAPSSDQAP